MNKRETVKEIARCSGTAYLSRISKQALNGETTLDRALTETSKHARTAYAKRIADEAIDKGES